MTTYGKILIVPAMLALTACAEKHAPAQPVDVNFSSKSSTPLRGYGVTIVRSFVKGENGREEVIGVPCVMQGTGFSAKFQTPAAVNVPVYGLASRVITAKCTYNGVEQQVTRSPYNMTEAKAVNAGAGGGLIGAVIVAGAVAARKDRNSDEYGYSPLFFTYEKE